MVIQTVHSEGFLGSFYVILSLASSQAWCCVGDFNDILSVNEKRGDAPQSCWLIDGFRHAFIDTVLIDLPL